MKESDNFKIALVYKNERCIAHVVSNIEATMDSNLNSTKVR